MGRSGQRLLSQFARNVLAAVSFTLSLPAPTSPVPRALLARRPCWERIFSPGLLGQAPPSSRPPLLSLRAPMTPAEPWALRAPVSTLPGYSRAAAAPTCEQGFTHVTDKPGRA